MSHKCVYITHDADGMRETTVAEQDMIDLLEKLRDTVDQIPVPMIKQAELLDFVGPVPFEEALAAVLRGVGVTFRPNDASDFVKMLEFSLSFLHAA